MALEISNRIWKSGTKGSDKLMLLALADFADSDGICWPAYETLGKMCGVTKRQAIKTVDKLVNKGLLLKFQNVGRGNANIYLVKVGLSDAEINGIVLRRFNKKGELLDTFYDRKKVSSEVGKGVIRDTINEAQKVNSRTQKVNSSAQKGELQDTRTIIEPSKEPSSSLPKGKAPAKRKPKKCHPLKSDVQQALVRMAHWHWPAMSEKQIGVLSNAADKLAPVIADSEQIADVAFFESKFITWWEHYDWRGQKSQSPKPNEAQESFGEFLDWLKAGAIISRNGASKNAAHKQNQASQNDVDAAIQRAKQDALRGHPI